MVRTPLVLTMSLTWNGTPCSGPSSPPLATALSAAAASPSACSAQMVMKQLQAACTSCARSSVARITSVAEICFARIMRASSAADVKARSEAVMG